MNPWSSSVASETISMFSVSTLATVVTPSAAVSGLSSSNPFIIPSFSSIYTDSGASLDSSISSDAVTTHLDTATDVITETETVSCSASETPVYVSETAVSVSEATVSVVETPVSVSETAVSVVETPVSVSETAVSVVETPVSVVETAVSVSETAVSVVETPVSVSETAVSVSETAVSVVETAVSVSETAVSVSETPLAATSAMGTNDENITFTSVLTIQMTEKPTTVQEGNTLITSISKSSSVSLSSGSSESTLIPTEYTDGSLGRQVSGIFKSFSVIVCVMLFI
ncbi:unnamed protein product [[Candida] boidinii]|nr:unnamed protein product [[Candida] boidinii]